MVGEQSSSLSTTYPRHPDDAIPGGIVKVDVGFREHRRDFEATMVAGAAGYCVQQTLFRPVNKIGWAPPRLESSLKPQVGWWIYEPEHEQEA